MNIQDKLQGIHAQFGTTEMANYRIQKLCEEYARIQIEKDRERVKMHAKVACVIDGNKIDVASYVKADGDSFKVSTKSIDETPIALD